MLYHVAHVPFDDTPPLPEAIRCGVFVTIPDDQEPTVTKATVIASARYGGYSWDWIALGITDVGPVELRADGIPIWRGGVPPAYLPIR